MNKLNGLLCLVLLILAGCKQSDMERVFDETPNERMSELQREVKQQLTDAKYGWRVLSTTLSKGKYGHYMDFDANGDKDRVRMVSDINNITSEILRTSAYRVKLINAPMLSFETYNYIHELGDPDPNVIGGEIGEGLKADIEFELKRTTADSLFFVGRKFRSELILVRATEAEQQVYLSGKYKDVINEVKSIFVSNQINLFNYKGITHQMTVNSDSRTLGIMHVVDQMIETSYDLFSFTADGMQIGKKIPLGDTFVVKVLLENHKLYIVTENGEKLEIKASTSPLLPLDKLMGTMYTKLFSPFRVKYPGTNAAGDNILYEVHRQIPTPPVAGGASKVDLELVWDAKNKYIYLRGLVYYSVVPDITIYRYSYTLDEATGLFKLSNEVEQAKKYANVTLMRNFLKANEFRLEYYYDNGNAYGRIVSKDGKVTMTMMPLADK